MHGLDIDDEKSLPAIGRLTDLQLVLRDRLHLVSQHVPGRVVGLTSRDRPQALRLDGHRRVAKQQPPHFEGGVQLAEPVEEEPGRIGAGDGERLGDDRLDQCRIVADDGRQAAGRIRAQIGKRAGSHANAEVGGVVADLVHAPFSSPTASAARNLSSAASPLRGLLRGLLLWGH